MATTRLTGNRIRERRIAAGIRQADLARSVGISPSYLNLIEHNRRRIGGKLIVDLARVLGAEPAQLTEGAEDALIAQLTEAAARGGLALDETGEAVEAFAGRFPGWAGLMAGQAARIGELERLVETLSDRLTHDPQLAASLHEVLSAVTAIRASASILTETRDIDPDWQARFLRNVGEDSARLSESAAGLVGYLDAGREEAGGPLSPADGLAEAVARAGYHWPELEAGDAGAGEIGAGAIGAGEVGGLAEDPVEAIVADHSAPATREMLRRILTRAQADARAMPVAEALAVGLDDPVALARHFGTGLDAALRRVAALGGTRVGLVTCDSSGTVTLAKPVDGFTLPRFGAACPFWPLYQALSRPAQPVGAVLEMPGRMPRRFRTRAVALPLEGTGFDMPPVLEATMIIEALDEGDPGPSGGVVEAGSSCRICPRDGCRARREPTILGRDG